MPGIGGPRSEGTRRAILHAARAMFAAREERTTIGAVAAEAGVGASMVMRYFRSKAGLFTAAISTDLLVPDLSSVRPDRVLDPGLGSPLIIGTLVIAVAAAAGFAASQLRAANRGRQPLMPLELWRSGRFVRAGLMNSPMSNSAVSSADASHSEAASATHNTFRQIGGTFGVAALGASSPPATSPRRARRRSRPASATPSSRSRRCSRSARSPSPSPAGAGSAARTRTGTKAGDGHQRGRRHQGRHAAR